MMKNHEDNSMIPLLAFRPPFFFGSFSAKVTTIPAGLKGQQEQQEKLLDYNHHDHNSTIRPALCGLLVGAHLLQFSMETTYTAAILLHRYCHCCQVPSAMNPSLLASSSSSSSIMMMIVATCLLLASKVQNEPRKLRDVINCTHIIHWSLSSSSQQQQQQPIHQNSTTTTTTTKSTTSGDGTNTSVAHDVNEDDHIQERQLSSNRLSNKQPTATTTLTTTVAASSELLSKKVEIKLAIQSLPKLKNDTEQIVAAVDAETEATAIAATTTYTSSSSPSSSTSSLSSYGQLKEKLIEMEQHVLQCLTFDLYVSHPHRAVVLLMEQLVQEQRPSQQQQLDLVTRAWEYLNNAIFYVEALQHGTIPLALGALSLAAASYDIHNNDNDSMILSRPTMESNMEQQQQQYQVEVEDKYHVSNIHTATSTTTTDHSQRQATPPQFKNRNTIAQIIHEFLPIWLSQTNVTWDEYNTARASLHCVKNHLVQIE